MKAFFIGLLLGTIAGVFAMQNHVVRTGDGIVVIPRANRPPLRSTVADVRDWTASMWQQYPELKSAVVEAGRADLISSGNALGNRLNGPDANGRRSTQAASTASDSNVAIRFLQEERSLAPIGGYENVPANRQVPRIEQPTSSDRPSTSAPFPFEAILGPVGPFPGPSPAADTSAPQVERIFPFSPRRSGPWGAMPRAVQPHPPKVSRAVPLPEQTTDQQQAAGPNSDWVRGLLNSLIPPSNAAPLDDRADAGQMDAPPPSTAGQTWKPISYEGFVAPQAPLRAVRPF